MRETVEQFLARGGTITHVDSSVMQRLGKTPKRKRGQALKATMERTTQIESRRS